MFKKVLVANRGEIAVRIIRACHDLGIRAVVAHSEADRESLAVRLADEAICIGPAPARSSYLNTTALLSAAHITRCDAIHPGYGFLAENAAFAELCARHHLTFVAPPPEAIRSMASKIHGRRIMREAGVPVVPGSENPLHTLNDALEIARRIGYPVMIKPDIGGGGRGLRMAFDGQELAKYYAAARAEAEVAFGRGDVLLEQYLPRVRHIEIQVLADNFGNTIHLGERDCSAQRRHQKIVEESPSPIMTPDMRERMGAAVLRGVRSIGYTGVGTAEFLVDQEGNFSFIEMNTRIQLEHGVTELVSGIDLVKWQLLIAAGERLTIEQRDVVLHGHALECRINAEDPERDFLPVSGEIEAFVPPGGPGVRVDSHLYPGYVQPPFYDSLLAKVLTWGTHRQEALDRMRRALNECDIRGLKTTIPFHLAIMDDPSFRSGNISTRYVGEMMERWKNAA